MTKKPIMNIADVALRASPLPLPPGLNEKFLGAKRGAIASVIGAQKLGYNLTVLPPGRRAYPFHAHRINEEMFFVIEGEGTIRLGSETYPIRQGDVVACPPGGEQTAHQIVNTGTMELRYLAVSTKISPEIAEYPDSQKFGVLAEFGQDEPREVFRFLGRVETSLSYYDGEPEA